MVVVAMAVSKRVVMVVAVIDVDGGHPCGVSQYTDLTPYLLI